MVGHRSFAYTGYLFIAHHPFANTWRAIDGANIKSLWRPDCFMYMGGFMIAIAIENGIYIEEWPYIF